MWNPDVLLGCWWMSSAVYDTAVGLPTLSTDRETTPQGKTFCSFFLSSLHPASSLSRSFSPSTYSHFCTLFQVSPLIPSSSSPPLAESFCHSYRFVCTGRQGFSDQWQVVRGHVGAGSRKSTSMPTLTLALPYSHTLLHTHIHSHVQPAWWTSHVKCQLTNYSKESLEFKKSNAHICQAKHYINLVIVLNE